MSRIEQIILCENRSLIKLVHFAELAKSKKI